ncbi:tyrosine-type recombinase/integrase [Stutzerimonas xanthomarina]|uniref:tyrosine-type recombinase/integrase n=1 Tax=Stutzerimonas xanthomarina TaxID=271420 RepID=UPI003AA7CEA2
MKLLTKVGNGRKVIYLDSNGKEVSIFSAFRDELYSFSGLAINTIILYLGHISRFIEFIHACLILKKKYGTTVDYLIVRYEAYLVGTTESQPGVALLARRITGRSRNAKAHSMITVEAAITRFLWFANISGDTTIALESYLDTATRTTGFSKSELKAFREKSEAYGLYANDHKENKPYFGTRQYTRLFRCTTSIPENHDDIEWRDEKAIQFDKIDDLADSLITYRDKALVYLRVGFGIRTSEALGLTDMDIDIITREVWVRGDITRKKGFLTQEQIDRFSFKGRATQETMGHEPWASKFFHFYELYIKYERIPGVGHNFCFQILHGRKKGQPLFTANRSSLNRTFHKAAAKAGIDLVRGVAEHSLRHRYGVYTRHDAPTLVGHGFPEHVTQIFLGHKRATSSRKYTKKSHRDWLDTANAIIDSKKQEPDS